MSGSALLHTLRTHRRSNVGRFGLLLLALLAAFIGVPLFASSGEGMGASLLFSLLLVAGAYAVSRRRRVFVASLAIGGPALLVQWLSKLLGWPSLALANLILLGTFVAYISAVVFREVSRERRVTADTILGGVCVYLMIGVAWVALYAALELTHPGSFAAGGRPSHEFYERIDEVLPDLMYYSFVTMTTLGYGDIVPLTRVMRLASSAEAIVGQLFVAIFIARLVGLHLAGSRES